MTLEEAGKRFEVSMNVLERYISFGFIREAEPNSVPVQYVDSDFDRLGLISTLLSAGFTPEETKKYLLLTENRVDDEEEIRMLRKQRRTLMNDIHKKQQLLDHLDYMIFEKKK